MFAIPAIYDGQKFVPSVNIPTKKKYKVIITFVEEADDNLEASEEFVLHGLQMSSLARVWNHPEENIYEDYHGIS